MDAGYPAHMGTLADTLASLPFLYKVGPREIARTESRWRGGTLAAGEVLWREGEEVRELAILLSGELEVLVDGRQVGFVAFGELVGEAAAFSTGTPRTATVRATEDSRIVRLSVDALQALRSENSPIYDVLLETALRTLARRVRGLDKAIARISLGEVATPKREEVSALVRLWRGLKPGKPTGKPPPLLPLLRAHPSLAHVPSMEELAANFVPQAVGEGEILFLEGEPGVAMYVVAEGRVDVLRHTAADKAVLLAQLGPGALFGFNPLVDPGMRAASCVATTKGWVYRLDGTTLQTLAAPLLRAWREAMLATLTQQVVRANEVVLRSLKVAIDGLGTRPHVAPTDMRELLRAASLLEAVVD